jgi:tetratricopeptide (TPR) repeat protein
MLQEQGARLRRVVFEGRSHNDRRYGWFWATSGDDSRALFEELATIQHYIRGDEGTFLKSLPLARSFTGSEHRSASRTALLLDVLEANYLVRNGKIEAAVDCYRRRILKEERTYRAMLRRRQLSDARRQLPEQRQVLGLLELNLATLLGRTSSDSTEAERHYQQARVHMPASTYAHRSYAEFLVSQKRWEQAIEKFREAYAEGGFDDTSSELNASLAWAYREWAQWLNSPPNLAVAPEAGDTVVSSRKSERFAAFRSLFPRLAHKVPHAGAPTPPSPLHSSAPRGPSQALFRLEQALQTLKWTDIRDWEGTLRFDRALILDQLNPDGNRSISDEFLKSAECHSAARNPDPANIASAFERAGDVLVKRGLVREAIAAYEDGLKQAEGIELKEDWRKQQKRNTVDTLLSKLAITRLGLGEERAASTLFERLREQWWAVGPDGRGNARRGAKDWGSYYDVQSLGVSLLARADLRHSLTTYYHRLLASEPRPKDAQHLRDARDITSALLDLYRVVRQGTESRTENADMLSSASTSGDMMNVVTPLAIEISENLATLLEYEDQAIRGSPTFALDDIKDLPSLAERLRVSRREHARAIDVYLADQLSPAAQAALASYESSFSDPIPLQTALVELLGQIVGGPSVYGAKRFRDIVLRSETHRLLARKPHGEDLRLLNALLLVDAYPRELSRNALARYMGPVRRRIEAAFGVRIPGVRVRSSSELKGNDYRLRIHELDVAGGTCNDQRLARVFLDLERVVAANLVEFLGHQETQNYLERNKLVAQTVEDISEKEHCSHMDPLAAVLRALVTERVPLTEPKATYEVFRSGWKEGLSTATIVERIRLIPSVRARLWGNDGKRAYVLFSSSAEGLLASAMRTTAQSDYLVMKEGDRRRILAAIGTAIAGLERPALIARRQEQRALVRQLVAAMYPDVPVLSISELRSGANQISEMPDLSHQGIES